MKFFNVKDRLNTLTKEKNSKTDLSVKQSDVVLKISRDDLATLLSELLNSVNEGTSDTCVLPLKLNVELPWSVPAADSIYFTVDEKMWRKEYF